MKYLMNISGDIPHAGLSNINIPLNGRNLIITGRNGSGKTSLLKLFEEKIILHLTKEAQVIKEAQQQIVYWENKKNQFTKGSPEYSRAEQQLKYQYDRVKKIQTGLQLEFNNEFKYLSLYDDFKAIFRSFKAMRTASINEATHTSSIEDEKKRALQDLKNNYDNNLGVKFEQHLVNIKINQSLAITEENNTEQAKIFAGWFSKFDKHLQFLFENESARLVFYRKNYKFKISLDDREFEFQNLSSGYLAIFDILADLLMRTEFYDISPEELSGIVLIDEIDAHLHISLQKKILPFFIKLFPNIQFIVSTHSPFVITSTNEDTVVYDLTSKELIEDDLSGYSNEAIIKGLFHVETNSLDLTETIQHIYDLINMKPQQLNELSDVLRKLQPYKSKLNPEAKSIYMQGINHLIDNESLGDLDV